MIEYSFNPLTAVPLVLSDSRAPHTPGFNTPLLLFIFRMCLTTLQSILLPHSCLFMGETVLLLLNSLLFALSHLLRPSCSTQPQCLHPHPLAPHPLIQIPLLSLLLSLHLPLLALNARDVPEKSESEIAITAQLMGSRVLMDSSWHSGQLMVSTWGCSFFSVFFRNAL